MITQKYSVLYGIIPAHSANIKNELQKRRRQETLFNELITRKEKEKEIFWKSLNSVAIICIMILGRVGTFALTLFYSVLITPMLVTGEIGGIL